MFKLASLWYILYFSWEKKIMYLYYSSLLSDMSFKNSGNNWIFAFLYQGNSDTVNTVPCSCKTCQGLKVFLPIFMVTSRVVNSLSWFNITDTQTYFKSLWHLWWHISAITCQIIMLICQILSSFQIFILTC